MNSNDNDDYAWKIILWLILFFFFGIIIVSCIKDPGKVIMTVNGPLKATEAGITLTHEHILVDFIGADSTGSFRWNRDSVSEKITPYLTDLKKYGVKTFIDCSPEYLGRDPLLLKEISTKTGLTIITNTGYYGFNNIYLPSGFSELNPAELAGIWINEFMSGISGTDVRPGFIKIAVNARDTLSINDSKLITAAGFTHLRTGMVIASHTGPEMPAFAQIEILKQNGIDPSAFIWVHAQRGSLHGNLKAARSGAWISLDNIRNRPNLPPGENFSITWYADRIKALRDSGFLNKILLSHDAGWYDPAKPGGGNVRGYTDLFEYLIPELRIKGLSDEEIYKIIASNPADAFSIEIRKLK